MAIDLRKNKDALLKAYNDVIADSNSTDWAVFTYEAQTAVLKVTETGEGGIGDMVDELNSSKIMYAYCKVMDPNTSLPKFVLINWQGEAAPESMKFKCANHMRDVASFFHGIHVTINARTEDDVDEDEILKKVSNSSGSQYSIHREKAKPAEPITAVGSVYQKTQAARDINIKARDKFWARTESEEQDRQQSDRRTQLERQQSMESERKSREAKEAEDRERQVQDRMKVVHQQRAAERRASQTDDQQQKKQWELDQEHTQREEEERGHRADHLRRERAAEAEKLATAQTSTARSFFKRKESQSEDTDDRAPPPRQQLKHNFGQVDQEEPPATRQPIQLPRKQPSPPPTQPFQEPSPPPQRQPSPPPQREPSPPPQREPSPPPREPSPPPQRQPSPPPAAPAPTQPPAGRNLLSENLPPRQVDSDEEEAEEDDWGDDGKSKGNKPKTAVEQDIPAVHAPDIPIPEPVAPTPASTEGKGMCCIALYDYQASDDTEVTFDPDEVITDVEQIDDGWWIGTVPDGSRGMFPANYVEIIQS